MSVKIITLCGSTRFRDTFESVKNELIKKGYTVLAPITYIDRQKIQKDEILRDLFVEIHRKKIELSDAILVLNVGGYIGKATEKDIEWAKEKNKQIFYLEEKNG